MPSVRILNGDASNRTFRITGGEQVGRDPTNAIQVQDPGVSRRHFQFRVEGAQVWLEDEEFRRSLQPKLPKWEARR